MTDPLLLWGDVEVGLTHCWETETLIIGAQKIY